MQIDLTNFSSDLGPITDIEHRLMVITLAVLRRCPDEGDYLTCWLIEQGARAGSAIWKHSEAIVAASDARRSVGHLGAAGITPAERRLLALTLGALRGDRRRSAYLAWWLCEYGDTAVSPKRSPLTEDEIEENRLFLVSLGLD